MFLNWYVVSYVHLFVCDGKISVFSEPHEKGLYELITFISLYSSGTGFLLIHNTTSPNKRKVKLSCLHSCIEKRRNELYDNICVKIE